MQCPPCPRRCRWPGSCPADSASAGQSLPGEPPPGTRQCCLVEVDKEALPDFLLPWNGRGRALPAPARKGGSWVTVLWVVEVGDPRRSKTEVLEAVFLDDVTFVRILGSRCFWAKVTDEPAIRSACLMVHTRLWRTFGSRPTTWFSSNGAVRTEEKTWGWKPKFATKQLQVRRGRKACRHRGNLCFLNYGQLLPEKFRTFILGREFFYYRSHHRVCWGGVNGGPQSQLFCV